MLPLFVAEAAPRPRRRATWTLPALAAAVDLRRPSSEAREAAALGLGAVMLFGIPAHKDAEGSGAWDEEGVVQLAMRAIKQALPDAPLVITDVCLCEYTDHGHCGVAARGRLRSTTTPRSSCSRAPPSATRAPAPTWSRRRT